MKTTRRKRFAACGGWASLEKYIDRKLREVRRKEAASKEKNPRFMFNPFNSGYVAALVGLRKNVERWKKATPNDEAHGSAGRGVKPLRILVAFECSGAIRRELRKLRHDAWSCDLNPARDGSEYHLQGDVHEIIDQPLRMLRHSFDAMLAVGPTCRYLTISAEWAYKDPDFVRYPGVGYHQRLKPGTLFGAERRAAREAQIERVKELWDCGIEIVVIENPIGALSSRWRKPDQIIQPNWFGDDASKATCLWLKGVPPLVATQQVPPRIVNGRPRWANQTDSGQNKLSPSEDREELRSATYPGVARAMATQWFGGRRGLGCGEHAPTTEAKYNDQAQRPRTNDYE